MRDLAVFGLWRDSEKHIHRTLKQLENLSTKYKTEFFFYENDSLDNTRHILIEWMKNKLGTFIYEDIKTPRFGSVSQIERFIFMSYYRNKLNSLSKTTIKKYSLLIDTDIIFDNDSVDILYDSIIANNAVMCVANIRQPQIPDLVTQNTSDSFYDVIPFKDKYGNNGLFFSDCPLILEEDRRDWKQSLPVRIMSGFSGLSLLKTEALQLSKWSTNGQSEHVNFCYDVNKHGPIFAIPSSKPIVEVDDKLISSNIDRWKEIGVQQASQISMINQVYSTSIASSLSLK